MPETKEDSALVLHFIDELRDVLFDLDLLQHSDHSFVGSSVFGPVEGSSCHSDSSVEVDSGTGDVPDERSGAVHLMLSMEDEEHFQGSDQLGVRLVLTLIESVHHEEEVLNIAHMFVGDVVLSSDSVPVRIGSNSRSHSQHAVYLLVSERLVLVDLLASKSRVCLRFKSREGRYCGDEHPHRVGAVAEGLHLG